MITGLVVVAGAIGALLRYEVDLAVRRRWAGSTPVGILLVNLTGALILGVLVGAASHHRVDASVVTVAGTGLLGAYTTFSTLSWDTVGLAGTGRSRLAVANLALSLALGLGAAALGLFLGQAV